MRRALVLLLLCQPALAQSDDPSLWLVSSDDAPEVRLPALSPSPARDSLERALAFLAVTRAEELVTATSFWYKLIPRIQLGASAGVREVVFHDITGALMLPKDSYRLSATLPLDELFDGSRHALALLERDQARTRFALLLEQQARAHELIRRRCLQLDREIPVQQERVLLFRSLAEYHELLFVQGKIEYGTLLRSRQALLMARKKLDDLEHSRVDLDTCRRSTPGGGTPK